MSAEPRAAEDGTWHPLPIQIPEPGETAPCELSGVSLLVCNVDHEVHVVHNQCPHVQVPLTEGKLRGAVLECPLHGGELDVRDGRAVALPIRTPVPCFATRWRGSGGEEAGAGDPGSVLEVRLP